MSLKKVETALQHTPGVSGVHELHIWNICSGHIALSAHITIDDFQSNHTDLREGIRSVLLSQFGIEHTTLQFESEPCDQQLSGCGGSV
jgi:cobalt-zinc-cadmium efflux system protein